MHQRPLGRVLITVVLAAFGAGLAVPTAAEAAAPTRVTDRAVEVACSATGTRGEEVNFYVGTSELAGSVGAVQAATADGEYLGRGEGSSDWTADTFRSSVEIFDSEDRSLGSAYLSGGYSAVGSAERFTSKFKDGNIRVVEDHAFTAVSVRGVTISFPGVELGPVSCDASRVTGSLFFTNPTAHIGRDGGLVVEDCTMVNAEGFFVEGSIDALGVGLGYADDPDYSAFSPAMDLSDGEWTGSFNAADDDGPVPVDARVTLQQSGDTVTVKDSGRWGSERFVITPYRLVVRVDGPMAPAEVTCQLVDVDYRFRMMRH
jgi:Tfp pilus assembly protein FimT